MFNIVHNSNRNILCSRFALETGMKLGLRLICKRKKNIPSVLTLSVLSLIMNIYRLVPNTILTFFVCRDFARFFFPVNKITRTRLFKAPSFVFVKSSSSDNLLFWDSLIRLSRFTCCLLFLSQ